MLPFGPPLGSLGLLEGVQLVPLRLHSSRGDTTDAAEDNRSLPQINGGSR